MKPGKVLLLVVTALALMVAGGLSPRTAAASVDFVNKWPATPTIVSNANVTSVSGTFTPGIGNNRLMLVAVAAETSAAPSAVNVTFGGQALTAVVSNTAQTNKIWLYRLNEAGIVAAGTNRSLSVSFTAPGTVTATYVSVAVFNGVNQTTPITGNNANATASGTTIALNIPLTGNSGLAGNNGMAVYLANWNGQTSTPASGYTEVRDYAGTSFNLAACYKVTAGTTAEAPTTTAAALAIGAAAGVSINPQTNIATNTTCGDCHGNFPGDGSGRNAPPGQFTGSHEKHAGGDNGQYKYLCTQCHKNNTTYNHVNGFKNVSGSSLPRNAYNQGSNIAVTNTPTMGTCTNVTCHSTGRTNRQYVTSPAWGGTTTCLSCHGGRNSGTSAYAKNASNFTMSTTHQQHLGKYTSTEINCQHCHGKIAASHTALKDYTGAIYHGNGTKNVLFTNIAYGSYTSYKTTGADQGKCTNTACHGGKSRSTWSNQGAVNTYNTCAHCHGVATASAALANTKANRKYFAPGYKTGGNTGTSTDQLVSTNDYRVGSHFKHISSVYMRTIQCNECHSVPDSPFSGTHMTGGRFNSQTLTFNQSSTAKIAIGVLAPATPAQLASFAGYTNGNGAKAATCSSVYCHGNRLKTNDSSGSYTKPYWNYSAMINYTNPNQACGRCHGNPPTAGTSAGTHSGKTPTTSCSACHGSVVSPSGQIINKNLHINGQVNATGGHVYGYGGIKHRPGGTGDPLANAPYTSTGYSQCSGCHQISGALGTYSARATHVVKSSSDITCTECHYTSVSNFLSANPGCGDCHGTNANGGLPNGAATAAAFPNWSGSHSAHAAAPLSYACSVCHQGGGTGTPTHGNYSGIKKARTQTGVNVTLDTAAAGTAATRTWNGSTVTCSTSKCHGQKSPQWGEAVPNAQCVRCHGNQSVSSLNNFTTSAIAPGTGNLDTNRATGVTNRGGMHQEHLQSTIARKVRCQECHTTVTVINQASHMNYTTATLAFTGVAVSLGHTGPVNSRSAGIMTCNTNECHHGGQRAEGTAAGQTGFASRTPVSWNSSSYLNGTDIAGTCTGKCHMMPPGGGVVGDAHANLSASGSYTTPASLSACSSQTGGTGCHPTINAAPTNMSNIFFDKNLHINGIVEGGDCLSCHNAVIGTAPNQRANVKGAFMSQSHHIQGAEQLTNAQCYQCHMEANSDGTINATYHLKTTKASVDLVVWGAGSRGTAYIAYTANGSRKQISKLNNHCLSCHNSVNATQTPFGTYRTDFFSPEAKLVTPLAKTSILSRYSSTRTVAWSQYKYSSATGGVKRFGTNNKPYITKALSAHGNATKNQMMDWDTVTGEERPAATAAMKDNTYTGTNSARNVLCYDCHNSHGSNATGITSSYSSATGRYKGGMLKTTQQNVGGYTVNYTPAGRTIQYRNYSAYTKTTATVNPGASICNDCHNTDTRFVNISKPWSVTATYSSTKAISGYWSTPYFENYTVNPAKRLVYKRGAASGIKNMTLPMGGHFGTSISSAFTGGGSAAHTQDINGLCTPCHDPHGVSSSMTTVNRGKSVPLLKGTWVTSPYREDKAEPGVVRGGGCAAGNFGAQGAAPGYHIDQNTFMTLPNPVNSGAGTATSRGNRRAQAFRNMSNNALKFHTEKTAADASGLCLECHTRLALTGNAAQTTSQTWMSKERVHQSVAGWGASNGTNANNAVHAYTCSKCHAPHVSRLPRLLVTNCLDARHFKRNVTGSLAGGVGINSVASGTTTPGNIIQSTLTNSAFGAGRFPGGGSRYSGAPGTAQNPGPWWFQTNGPSGTTPPTVATYGSSCHNAAGAGGTTYNPATQIWNKRTRW